MSTDMVFRDGSTHPVPTVTGGVANGYPANLVMAVA